MPDRDWNAQYTSGGQLPWDTGTPDPHLAELFRTGRLKPGRALDVGCGTGTNVVFMAQQGCEAMGVDLSPRAIELARQRSAASGAKAQFAAVDFLREPLKEKPFNLVFDRGCFHVFDRAADQRLFAERVAALLAPGGVWVSLIGSTEGPPRDMGPPRRSARDVLQAIEPSLQLLELRAVKFEVVGPHEPAAWLCLSGKREVPAQPSTQP